MRIIASRKNRGLRKTTAAALVPCLMAQVLIAMFCVPQTLQAGAEIRSKMTWEDLHSFLPGEKNVTVLLTEDGAFRGDVGAVLPDSIYLIRITRATDWKQHPWGSETSIARDSVKEIRVETMRRNARFATTALGGLGGFFLGPRALIGSEIGEGSREGNLLIVGVVGGTVGGAYLGYWLGKRWDRETTIITIVD